MKIFTNAVVTLNFKLFDADGELIEQSATPVTYLHGGYSGIFPKAEDALNFKEAGDTVKLSLEPSEAFGDHDPALVRLEPLARLPPDTVVGGYLSSGDDDEPVWRVTEISEGKAVLDGNHELAGQRVLFECTVLDVRAATEEEIEHGHPHGAHGCCH
ncbi:MAG: peptidylprolyl isomerase [Burkholderiales bacterium]|jgi:FKBP-type peptidyl-prolyl cis-trans isomerase SlyD|nr:peptidylprolyl isomerase [Burkholderiales bacterium]